MTKQIALPPTLAPRLIGRESAAAYVCCSPMLFDRLVSEGIMPPAKQLTTSRKAWDVRELDLAIDNLPRKGGERLPLTVVQATVRDDFGWE
ncbi:helix-turn-helix transcriptional regulator [Bradyrhizobium shewense]|uniref:helix-turn-helix transcriptional regulator n=1 Tax=Bradyrhizobium shewense TaxID=1761772 RepID=UPI000B88AE8E|nr:hypothetical protein [Bradyrhizobium shewense]